MTIVVVQQGFPDLENLMDDWNEDLKDEHSAERQALSAAEDVYKNLAEAMFLLYEWEKPQ